MRMFVGSYLSSKSKNLRHDMRYMPVSRRCSDSHHLRYRRPLDQASRVSRCFQVLVSSRAQFHESDPLTVGTYHRFFSVIMSSWGNAGRVYVVAVNKFTPWLK